jgi:hypothetical protein
MVDRKVVPFDEFYYQLKLMYVIFVTRCIDNYIDVEHAILYIFCSLCFFVRSIVS